MSAVVTGEQAAANILTLVSCKTKLNGSIKSITPNGHRYEEGAEGPDTFDCQGAFEWAHREAGFPMSYAGVNSMIRGGMCAWLGTMEECVKKFGKVPVGAPVFIWANDGGEPAKYREDGLGNYNHLYIKAADGWLVHASASYVYNGQKGWVAGKEFADVAIPNGGPNRVGLVAGIYYADIGYLSTGGADADAADNTPANTAAPVDTSGFYTVKRKCKGGAVERLQTWLVELGYSLSIDHEFGPKTENAVIDFQSKNNLKQDGIVGPLTWAALAQARFDKAQEADE